MSTPPERLVRVAIAIGRDLDDALVQFGHVDDCIGCSVTAATLHSTPESVVEKVLQTFAPLAHHDATVRPRSTAAGLLRKQSWTRVDPGPRAQRLHTVKMPNDLVGAQRLIAIQDLRTEPAPRPTIAIGFWTLFAHPVVRRAAAIAGPRDGLIPEIALAVHPDRYIVLDRDSKRDLVFAIESIDPIATELVVLSLRQGRTQFPGAGPWEDPLVQAATEVDLGVRTFERIRIVSLPSPDLSLEQQQIAHELVRVAAESIGVRPEN